MILQYVKQIGTAVYQRCGVGFRGGMNKIIQNKNSQLKKSNSYLLIIYTIHLIER